MGKHLRRYVVEPVVEDHRVVGGAAGYSGAVVADAGEGDLDSLIGGDGVVGWGERGEIVGAKNGAEILDIEEGFDDGESGSVGGHIADKSFAGGAGGAAAEGLRKAEV